MIVLNPILGKRLFIIKSGWRDSAIPNGYLYTVSHRIGYVYRRTPFGEVALGYFHGSAEQGSAIHFRPAWCFHGENYYLEMTKVH